MYPFHNRKGKAGNDKTELGGVGPLDPRVRACFSGRKYTTCAEGGTAATGPRDR